MIMERLFLLGLTCLIFMHTSAASPVNSTEGCESMFCTKNEVCWKIHGGYGCACGNNTKPNPYTYDAIETCSGSTGSLSLSRCQLFEAGYSIDTLHLNNPRCKGTLKEGSLVFSFDSHDKICNTSLQNNGTHIIFMNSVGTTNGTGVISRSEGLNINFSCSYPVIESISMPLAIYANKTVIYKGLSSEGYYQITMIPYTNATFDHPYTGNVTLKVNEQMYIALEVTPFDSSQVALVLDHCWATPFNQSDSFPQWDLIVNECPNKYDSTVKVFQNGNSTVSQFSFRMFTFTGFSNKIYLHCKVHLCLKKSGNCPAQCPHHRRRRSVDFFDSAFISMEV
ncbi:uromodulin-like [Silurus meridionalis]|uniref:uromodulin-like n=1 Tax=Silurus meridionalis TaxID=175797 RepID=UPI001EEC659A|nr:uromodulin-like [Silurus meridionalis]